MGIGNFSKIGVVLIVSVVLGFAGVTPADGAHVTKNIHPSLDWHPKPVELTDCNGVLFFAAMDDTYGQELWKSDGSEAGTVMVKDINPSTYSTPRSLAEVNGVLFFNADDGTNGRELWKSDGTESGTVMVKDIYPGATHNDYPPTYLTDFNGVLFFSIDDGTNGRELWKSNGTEAGTVMVKDINPSGNSSPYSLTVVNSLLFFQADDANGRELWKTDGTESGTVMVKDIKPIGESVPCFLTEVNDVLFFDASDGTNGRELWKSDGTESGTVMVKNINPSGDSDVVQLTDVNNILFFRANDGTYGDELWKSDGTESGTVMVKDINPDANSAYASNITNVNGVGFFVATDGINGWELWKSDGTEAGTVMVKDIWPGVDDSWPYYLTDVNGVLLFSADDGTNGDELWKSDGTEAGTVMVADINSTGGSYPNYLTEVNDVLFFIAMESTYGREVWVHDEDDTDEDGFGDRIDNCPSTANPSQSDIDGDGAGDLCDSCPADPCDECETGGSTAEEIDADEGGTIETPDGYLSIEIEPGDLEEDATLSVTQSTPPDPDVDIMIGFNSGWGEAVAVYDFEPDGLTFNDPVTVTVTVDVTAMNQTQRENLRLYYWSDDNGGHFEPFETVSSSIEEDPPGYPPGTWIKVFVVELDHFSKYAVVLPAEIIYVYINTPDNNDGSNWDNAYKYLQDGLAHADSLASRSNIWVAEGTYVPDANSTIPGGTGNRNTSFQLISGVALYGGFAGVEDPCTFDFADRDFVVYETILSGDLDANDAQGLDPCDLLNDPNRQDNCYTVVTSWNTDANAIIDGFTITAGNANGPELEQASGGGMFNYSSTSRVANCTFITNSAQYGGAIKNYQDNPTIDNCTFIDNYADYGGAINNDSADSAVVKCTFIDNTAGANGGGMWNGNDDSTPTVINCTFRGNTAGGGGGGFGNFSSSDPTLVNCDFSGNSAANGAGLHNFTGNPTLASSTFSGNTADANGGGIYDDNPADFTSVMKNCIFWGNSDSGGTDESAQVYVVLAEPQVKFCCIGDTDANDVYIPFDGATYGNIDDDPMFVDADGPDGIAGTEDDNLRLSPDSNCIDAGNNNSVPADTTDLDNDANTTEPIPFDLDGRPRFADGDCNSTEIVDMGACEFSWVYIGDFYGGCDVDFQDFAVFALAWLLEDGEIGYNTIYDISLPVDAIIDEYDLEIFTDNWLEGK